MPVMQVAELKKSYGSVQAVKGLSFIVEEGEIFGILGPNGAGKTTTLECALGTRKADAGSVGILGMDPVASRREVFARVGVQFQDSAWQAGIRVGEACESLACLYDPVPDWRTRLAEFGLEKRIRTAVESCSGGEKQKLAILAACLHSPELVILDELTTGLDPLARQETWDMIRLMRDRGTTVVLTSHFMDEVENLCGRAMIIIDGEKRAEGSIADLIAAGGGGNLDDAYVNLVRGGAA